MYRMKVMSQIRIGQRLGETARRGVPTVQVFYVSPSRFRQAVKAVEDAGALVIKTDKGAGKFIVDGDDDLLVKKLLRRKKITIIKIEVKRGL